MENQSDAPAASASAPSDPSSFLSEITGGPIVVKLNSGVEYRGSRPTTSLHGAADGAHQPGELSSVDGYMNIALEKTEEYVAGRLRNRYGDVFIRGNNGASAMLGQRVCELTILR